MRRYGKWAGSPDGVPEDTALCVFECGVSPHYRQCSRQRGHGPDGLYCKQHAKMLTAGRSIYVPPDEP